MDSLHTQMEFIESFEDLIDLEIIEPSIGDDSCINFEQYFDTDIYTRQDQESLLEEDEVIKEINFDEVFESNFNKKEEAYEPHNVKHRSSSESEYIEDEEEIKVVQKKRRNNRHTKHSKNKRVKSCRQRLSQQRRTQIRSGEPKIISMIFFF